MSILQITNLTHAFGDKELYSHAELSLYKGEHMGIVGQNGTGKSTLLNILLGEIVPSDGLITWQRGLSIGHLDQYAEVEGSLSIAEYLRTAYADLYALEAKLSALYLEMNEATTERQLRQADAWQQTLMTRDFYAIDSHIARVAAGLGLHAIGMERKLATLSGGQRTKAILAKLLLSKPDVLLLDEPTNFLDVAHIQWLTGYLNTFEGSFMIVSHDFDFLEGITNCICDIEFHTIKKYHGKYSDFLRQKEHLREEYVRQYNAQQREIHRLEDYIARNRVRTATARIAKDRQKKLDRIEVLAPTTVLAKPHIVFQSTPLTAPRALAVQALRVGYSYPLLPRLGFAVAGGQKVVITGFNGIGKSTLLKTIMGIIPAIDGRFAFDPTVRVGYFEQDMVWGDGGRTPLQIIGDAYPKLTPKQVRRELARYGVKADHVTRAISTLSGGEQNKVKLCRMSMTPCNFLILDEPTNHLDAETKEALRDAIAAFEGSVLLVCHEAGFYQGIVDREINMEKLLQ